MKQSSGVISYFFELANQDKKPMDKNSLATPIKCYETKESKCDEDIPYISIKDLNEEDHRSLEEFTFWLDAQYSRFSGNRAERSVRAIENPRWPVPSHLSLTAPCKKTVPKGNDGVVHCWLIHDGL